MPPVNQGGEDLNLTIGSNVDAPNKAIAQVTGGLEALVKLAVSGNNRAKRAFQQVVKVVNDLAKSEKDLEVQRRRLAKADIDIAGQRVRLQRNTVDRLVKMEKEYEDAIKQRSAAEKAVSKEFKAADLDIERQRNELLKGRASIVKTINAYQDTYGKIIRDDAKTLERMARDEKSRAQAIISARNAALQQVRTAKDLEAINKISTLHVRNQAEAYRFAAEQLRIARKEAEAKERAESVSGRGTARTPGRYSGITPQLRRDLLDLRDLSVDLGVIGSTLSGVFDPAIEKSAEFGRELRLIGTLVGEEQMVRLGSQVKDLDPRLGDVNQILGSVYEALQADVGEENVISFVEEAAKAAIPQGRDLQKVLVGGARAWTAYADQLGTASRLFDLFQESADPGIFKIDEFSQHLGTFIGPAARANQRIEEMLALYAQLSRTQAPARAAVSLAEILKLFEFPTNKARIAAEKYGIELGKDEVAARGVLGILKEIEKAGPAAVSDIAGAATARGRRGLADLGTDQALQAVDATIEKMDRLDTSLGKNEQRWRAWAGTTDAAIRGAEGVQSRLNVAVGEDAAGAFRAQTAAANALKVAYTEIPAPIRQLGVDLLYTAGAASTAAASMVGLTTAGARVTQWIQASKLSQLLIIGGVAGAAWNLSAALADIAKNSAGGQLFVDLFQGLPLVGDLAILANSMNRFNDELERTRDINSYINQEYERTKHGPFEWVAGAVKDIHDLRTRVESYWRQLNPATVSAQAFEGIHEQIGKTIRENKDSIGLLSRSIFELDGEAQQAFLTMKEWDSLLKETGKSSPKYANSMLILRDQIREIREEARERGLGLDTELERVRQVALGFYKDIGISAGFTQEQVVQMTTEIAQGFIEDDEAFRDFAKNFQSGMSESEDKIRAAAQLMQEFLATDSLDAAEQVGEKLALELGIKPAQALKLIGQEIDRQAKEIERAAKAAEEAANKEGQAFIDLYHSITTGTLDSKDAVDQIVASLVALGEDPGMEDLRVAAERLRDTLNVDLLQAVDLIKEGYKDFRSESEKASKQTQDAYESLVESIKSSAPGYKEALAQIGESIVKSTRSGDVEEFRNQIDLLKDKFGLDLVDALKKAEEATRAYFEIRNERIDEADRKAEEHEKRILKSAEAALKAAAEEKKAFRDLFDAIKESTDAAQDSIDAAVQSLIKMADAGDFRGMEALAKRLAKAIGVDLKEATSLLLKGFTDARKAEQEYFEDFDKNANKLFATLAEGGRDSTDFLLNIGADLDKAFRSDNIREFDLAVQKIADRFGLELPEAYEQANEAVESYYKAQRDLSKEAEEQIRKEQEAWDSLDRSRIESSKEYKSELQKLGKEIASLKTFDIRTNQATGFIVGAKHGAIEKEQKLVKRFAERWGIDVPTAIAEAQKAAEEFGETAEKEGKRASDALDGVEDSTNGVRDAFLQAVQGILNAWGDLVTTLLRRNDEFQESLSDLGQDISSLGDQGDFPGVWERIAEFASRYGLSWEQAIEQANQAVQQFEEEQRRRIEAISAAWSQFYSQQRAGSAEFKLALSGLGGELHSYSGNVIQTTAAVEKFARLHGIDLPEAIGLAGQALQQVEDAWSSFEREGQRGSEAFQGALKGLGKQLEAYQGDTSRTQGLVEAFARTHGIELPEAIGLARQALDEARESTRRAAEEEAAHLRAIQDAWGGYATARARIGGDFDGSLQALGQELLRQNGTIESATSYVDRFAEQWGLEMPEAIQLATQAYEDAARAAEEAQGKMDPDKIAKAWEDFWLRMKFASDDYQSAFTTLGDQLLSFNNDQERVQATVEQFAEQWEIDIPTAIDQAASALDAARDRAREAAEEARRAAEEIQKAWEGFGQFLKQDSQEYTSDLAELGQWVVTFKDDIRLLEPFLEGFAEKWGLTIPEALQVAQGAYGDVQEAARRAAEEQAAEAKRVQDAWTGLFDSFEELSDPYQGSLAGLGQALLGSQGDTDAIMALVREFAETWGLDVVDAIDKAKEAYKEALDEMQERNNEWANANKYNFLFEEGPLSGPNVAPVFNQQTNAALAGSGNRLPGFASGADFMVGGAGGVDRNVVAFRASKGERVRVTPPGTTGTQASAWIGSGPIFKDCNFYGGPTKSVADDWAVSITKGQERAARRGQVPGMGPKRRK